MAVVYRSERKKILRNHVQMSKWMVYIVQKAEELERRAKAGESLEALATEYKTLYLTQTTEEKASFENALSDDQKEDVEYWFYYRRMAMRSYLQQVHSIITHF